MFRIVTFNANGVRSALTKGFFNWFQAQNADVLCIQELKAQEKDIPAEVAGLPGYQAFFHCAEKKGYSGCGIWCRRKPDGSATDSAIPSLMPKAAMLRRSLVISASSPAISHRAPRPRNVRRRSSASSHPS